MAQKLWEKSVQVDRDVERFTVGKDREMDLYLAPFDILGSLAHISMLQSIGLLTTEELKQLTEELRNIYRDTETGKFLIEEGVEDVHSQVELLLTRKLGDIGKKIHSGRSRNDQVLVDLKLFTRSRLQNIVKKAEKLFDTLIAQSEKYKQVLMPGYTHLQVAMPSSFGLWFAAYAESLADDLIVMQAAYRVCNRNPLGSAAGYGSSFPLNRTQTTDSLGFETMDYNVVYAQMGRGKTERIVASAIASIAATLAKLAFDACLYNSQNFAFIKLPDAFTTGSSIMPQKKNPDLAELARGKAGRVIGDLCGLLTTMKGLPLAYNKDMQEDKDAIFDGMDTVKMCLTALTPMIATMKMIPENMRKAAAGGFINATDCADFLVSKGLPFRDAYKATGELVALCIKKGTTLEELPIDEYKSICPLFDEGVYDAINLENCVTRRGM